MTYRNSYRRPVQRTGPRANKFVRRAQNQYDGGCSTCGRLVPAGTGILTGNRDQGYKIRHGDRTWHGSPVSGHWTGGCEAAADMPVHEARPPRRSYARSSPWGGRCTHEDSPCCGCDQS